MDISALSLALGAKPETVGQVTGETGFDVVLEQVDSAGFIPPGAPPGPEPPPDLLVAGEEVEIVEPNAQSQKLDFHPLQKEEIVVELPQPFWEASADTENVKVDKPVADSDEAMKWLVGQMSDSFFDSPVVATNCPTPVVDKRGSKTDPMGSKKEPWYFCPSVPGDKHWLIDTEPGYFGTKSLLDTKSPKPLPLQNSHQEILGSLQEEAGLAIDQVVVDSLKIVSIDSTPKQSHFGEKPKSSIDEIKPVAVADSDDVPVEVPNQVGLPTNDHRSNSSERKELSSFANEGAKPDKKLGGPNSEMVRTKPPRESTFGEKAIKFDGVESIDSVPTVIAEKPSKEATPDDNRSNDKKSMTSKTEWAELSSAKSGIKIGEAKETEVEVDLKVDVSSVLTTAAPDLKKPSLKPEEAELVVKQVADKLHMLAAARPRNGVTIHLNPDDLGSITVVIKSIGRMVDTQITASDSRVSEALDQNRSRLVEAMDSKGYQLQSVSVSQQSGHSTQQDSSSKSWQQSNQEQSQRQEQSGQQHGHRGHHDRHLDQPKANVRAWSRRNEGVDLAI